MLYRFAEFEVDTRTLELRWGGNARKLEPQAFDLLLYMLRNPDRLISRDELIEHIWGGRIVSEATISSRISTVRRAIGDDGKNQALLKTVPRRGIRFVGEVEVIGGPDEAPAADPFPPSDIPSIVVLPFSNLSSDPEIRFVAEGLTQDIITSLSQIEAMFVISPNTSAAYREGVPDYQSLAKDLGVRYVLEGNLRSDGKRTRISAGLIEAQTGRHIWAERFDRYLRNVFDLEDEITSEIVAGLQVTLTDGEMVRIRRRQTSSLEAWSCMMRGVQQLRHFTPEANRAARRFLEEALIHDGEFAAAWSMLGWTHLVDARVAYTDSAEASLEQGAAAAEKGLLLDADNPDANSILGAIRLLQRRFDEAEALCLKGVQLGPSVADCHIFLAFVYNYRGRPAQAMVALKKAMRLSPVYPDWYDSMLALCYRGLGRFEEALETEQRRIALNPQNPFSHFRMAAVLVECGRTEEARRSVRAALAANPRTSLRQVRASEPFEDQAEMERYLDLLRRAGLPQTHSPDT
jgi:TolB-like protein/Tfp pilus assembly protein PilF